MAPPKSLQDGSTPLTEATFCILSSLTEPRHGYAVMQWVEQVTSQRVKLGPGTLYGALTSLQERGFIVPAGEQGDGAERRKAYVLTESGRRLIEGEVARLEAMATLGRQALKGDLR